MFLDGNLKGLGVGSKNERVLKDDCGDKYKPVFGDGVVDYIVNVTAERFDKGVVVFTVEDLDRQASLDLGVHLKVALHVHLGDDEIGDGSSARWHTDNTVDAPGDFLLLRLVLATLHCLLAAHASAKLDNLLREFDGQTALFLAREAF